MTGNIASASSLNVSGAGPKTLHIPSLDSQHEAHTSRLYSLHVAEHYIISGSADRTVRLWLKNTCQLALPPLLGHEGAVTAVELSEELGLGISGDSKGVMILWRLRDGHMMQRLEAHEDVVQALTVRGTTLVSTSRDLSAKVWQVKGGKAQSENSSEASGAMTGDVEIDLELRHTFRGHTMNVADAHISHDGEYVYTTSGDRSLRVWDLETGECVHGYEGLASMLRFQLIHEGRGTTVVGAGTDSTVRVYDVDIQDGTCAELACLEGHTGVVRSVDIIRGPSGSSKGVGEDWKIVSAGYDGTVKVWGRREEAGALLDWGCVETLSFSDEMLTPVTDFNHQELTEEGFVIVKNIPNRVMDMQVDGRWIYCCGEGAEIVAWELHV
ncbi:WD40 repeat-like protein [Lophiostoma macrostomum CBS 122681]|uniref:WD40 repeat-like protein n=1 Tax=Lophiostoma macrostomum CBS 122681 TaxID=1314788 RepID=A0A6A6SWX8_9PLEO|nr:WD40 repeat-like protein [Lophiostoma macrostomum CBS 122681]